MNLRLNWKQQNLVNILASVGIYFFYTRINADIVSCFWVKPKGATGLNMLPKKGDIVCIPYHEKIVLDGILANKTQGIGESFFKGHFQCEGGLDGLAVMLYRLARSNDYGDLPAIDQIPNSLGLIGRVITGKIFNFPILDQYKIANHYNLPDMLFTGIPEQFGGMLGGSNKYTCASYDDISRNLPTGEGLDVAQKNSLSYILSQLDLQVVGNIPVILDCGCGWGAMAQFLLDTLGEGNFIYIGVSIAKKQIEHNQGVFDNYRNVHFFVHSFNDPFDRILRCVGVEQVDGVIFLGSLEHAGPSGSKQILSNIWDIIRPNGKIYFQVVGSDHKVHLLDPYIWRYIFPNTVIMSPSQIGEIIEHKRAYRLVTMDNTYLDYYQTLNAWLDNFEKNWFYIEPYITDILPSTLFETTDEWKKHWEFYLLLCASFYKAGTYPQLYRITIQKNLNPEYNTSFVDLLTEIFGKIFNL